VKALREHYPNLQDAMDKNGVSVSDLAELLRLSKETVQKKLNCALDWSLTEAVTICGYLNQNNLKILFLRLDYKS
jgi:hypothetical protein